MVYLRTKGGTVGNQRLRFPNRFKILDEIMQRWKVFRSI